MHICTYHSSVIRLVLAKFFITEFDSTHLSGHFTTVLDHLKGEVRVLGESLKHILDYFCFIYEKICTLGCTSI